MRVYKTEGIIIKRRNTGEADRILTVFTKEYGKISIKAVGVRKISSKRSPHIELLNQAILTLYRGRGIPILTEAQTINSFSPLKKRLSLIGYAYHICELIDGLCAENQELKQVFSLFEQTLLRLQQMTLRDGQSAENGSQLADATFQSSPSPASVSEVYLFEIELLSLLGFWNKSHSSRDNFNAENFIEHLLERKLKSKDIFSKL